MKRIARAQTMRDEMKGRPRAALSVCAGERAFAVNPFDTSRKALRYQWPARAIESELTPVGKDERAIRFLVAFSTPSF